MQATASDRPLPATVKQTMCPQCQQEGPVLHDGLVDIFAGLPGTWTMRACSNGDCGLLWLDPVLCKEDLGWAYGQYFTHDADAQAIRERRVGLLQVYETLLAVLGPGWSRRRRARMFLPRSGGRLLDVGCGDGSLLRTMKDHGWTVEGIDFDPVSVNEVQARLAIPVRCLDIEEARLPPGAFDAVTLQHVIEHLPNPERALRQCLDALKPGGEMVVVTPNSESTYHRGFGRHWWPLEVPRHLHLYSKTSMARLLAGLGVTDARITTSAANNDSVYASSRRIKVHGSRGLDPRYPPGEILRALVALWWAWATHPLRRQAGEELVVRIRKPLSG